MTTLANPLAGLDPSSYAAHPMHSHERVWVETNCYVDPCIELVHSLGLPPEPMLAFCLGADFEGDQWAFLKPPLEDLRRLYGIEIGELNVWRPIADHVEEQLGRGRLVTVELDSFYLPDTRGVSYQLEHVKSTILPTRLDRDARTMDYLHNGGLHRLDGADYDALIGEQPLLPPYMELVRFDNLRRDSDGLREISAELIRDHLQRAPLDNPVLRMGERIAADLDWLVSAELATFHGYAFGMCRQSGACAQLAADLIAWFDPDLTDAVAAFRDASEQARVLQLTLARAARGRRFDIDTPITAMAQAWAGATDLVRARHGG